MFQKKVEFTYTKKIVWNIAVANLFSPRLWLFILVLVVGTQFVSPSRMELSSVLPVILTVVSMFAVFLVGSFLFMWRSFSATAKKGPITYIFSDSEIEVTGPSSSAKMGWDLVKAIRKTRSIIYLLQTSRLPILILPREVVDKELEAFLDSKVFK